MAQEGQTSPAPSSRGLRRSLKTRQIQMLAVGGVIGVGLFYGASLSVKLAGPGVILSFLFCGIMAAIVMRALAEMTVDEPVSGSFMHFATKYLGTGVGFVTGGMWWFYWVATVMSELAAIGTLIQYWFPAFPAWVPGVVALALFTISNLLTVKVFGELEYWFAILKVSAISIFMLFGVLIIVTGVGNHGHPVWLTNLWQHGGFLPNGITGVLASLSLVVQAYSGIETLAVESGESANPERNMRQAFKRVTWRIGILYVGSIFVMLCAFPWDQLIAHTGSPYVLMFARMGIPVAAGLVNLLIILSGLSSCNTGLYGGSRMLFGMARNSGENKFLSQTNRRDVPHVAVWITALMISVGILITYVAPDNVYVWITSASAFASLWTWAVILFSELKHRRHTNMTGQTPTFPVPMWPWLPLLGLVMLFICTVAIIVSPLTQISVFGGILWLFILILYHLVVRRRRESNETGRSTD